MTNGAEGAAMQPEDQMPSPVPAPAPTIPAYRLGIDRGVPKLGRGIVWSDLVREMEQEHAERLARAAERVTPLRQGRSVSGEPVEDVEEAA